MKTVDKLRPLEKISVYEVLDQLDFDLESWATDAKGRPNENPAVNGRAYAWSYRDESTSQDVFMLWHEDMAEHEGRIRYLQSWQELIPMLERTRKMTARRADNFLRHVSRLGVGAVVRVGIVEGSRAKSSDDESSRVAKRVLDPEFWHLSRWEPATSTYEFTRGLPPDRQQQTTDRGDQVSTQEGSSTQADIAAIMADDIGQTEKSSLIAARLGQGKFRAEVLKRWNGKCAITGGTTVAAIRASHCKPWRLSTNQERLDPANGLPLMATLDALFDAGLITFEDDGLLKLSSKLDDSTLHIEGSKLSQAPDADQLHYLRFHRREIFQT